MGVTQYFRIVLTVGITSFVFIVASCAIIVISYKAIAVLKTKYRAICSNKIIVSNIIEVTML